MEEYITRTEFEQFKKELEKQKQEESFTISDIAHKTTMALGILTAQESDIRELKGDVATRLTAIELMVQKVLDRLPE